MSEKKYTSGPWKVTDRTRKRFDPYTGARLDDLQEVWVDAGDKMIAIMGAYDADPHANARLIAAAPEMLRECKLALEFVQRLAQDQTGWANQVGYRNMVSRLQDVIASAEPVAPQGAQVGGREAVAAHDSLAIPPGRDPQDGAA